MLIYTFTFDRHACTFNTRTQMDTGTHACICTHTHLHTWTVGLQHIMEGSLIGFPILVRPVSYSVTTKLAQSW